MKDDDGNVVRYAKLIHEDLTEQEQKIIRNALLPLGKDVIIDLLTWLAVHKHMGSDQSKQKILFRDMSQILFGVPEYAMALAVVDLIEHDQSEWFPNAAKIKAAIAAQTVQDVQLDSGTDLARLVVAVGGN